MRTFNPAVLGLGEVTLPTVPKPTTPTTLPTVPKTPTPAPQSGGFWSTLDKILTGGQRAADIYDQVKSNSGSGPAYTSPTGSGGGANLPGTNIPQPDKGMSTGAKIAIGTAAAAALGTGIYFATRKKKGLGCPGEPAATPAEPTLNGPRRKKRKK